MFLKLGIDVLLMSRYLDISGIGILLFSLRVEVFEQATDRNNWLGLGHLDADIRSWFRSGSWCSATRDLCLGRISDLRLCSWPGPRHQLSVKQCVIQTEIQMKINFQSPNNFDKQYSLATSLNSEIWEFWNAAIFSSVQIWH
jgi:hypothetical protein